MADLLIAIELTPDIAAKIRFMAESGVFGVKTGNVILNFHEGAIKSIKTEIFSYPQSQNIDLINPSPILVKSA